MFAGTRFSLCSHHTGSFLSACGTMQRHILDWEVFNLVVGADEEHGLVCESNAMFMELEVVPAGSNDVVALRRVDGQYLSVDGDDSLSFRSKPQGPERWEQFEVGTILGNSLPMTYASELMERGWTLVPVFTAEQAAHLKGLVAELEGEESTWPDPMQKRIVSVATKHPALLQAATHPLLVGILSKFLGEHFRCATFSSNSLRQQDDASRIEPDGTPKGTGLGWHVDYPYHDIKWDAGWPGVEKPLGCQALFLLDEFTACNGGTLFCTGTHKLLRQPNHDYSTMPPGPDHWCEQLGRLPPESEWPRGFTPDPNICTYHNAPAGHVLIAHSAWWHRQVRNVAPCEGPYPRRRTALLGNFTPNFVVPKDDMRGQFEAILDAPWRRQLPQRVKKVATDLLLGPSWGKRRSGVPPLPSL